MPKVFQTLDKAKPVYDIVNRILMFLCKLLLIADILITSYAVLGRYCQKLAANYTALRFLRVFPNPPWTEEVVLTCMAYMAVLAAALAIRSNSHIRMTALDRYLPPLVVKVLDLVADLAVMGLALVMVVVGWRFANTLGKVGSYSSLPWLSKFWMYLAVPVAGAFMIVFEVEAIYNHIKAFFLPTEGKEAGA